MFALDAFCRSGDARFRLSDVLQQHRAQLGRIDRLLKIAPRFLAAGYV